MESILLLIDLLAIAALVLTSLRNDRLGRGDAQVGPFRFTRDKAAKEADAGRRRDPRTGRLLRDPAPREAPPARGAKRG